MNNIYVKLLSLAGILCFGGVLHSCDDYLTVYPTDQITEEKFWADKNDLNNVRAGAYTILNRTTPSVMLWGELRSDNFKLMKLDNTSARWCSYAFREYVLLGNILYWYQLLQSCSLSRSANG